jgi:hypothetical protein
MTVLLDGAYRSGYRVTPLVIGIVSLAHRRPVFLTPAPDVRYLPLRSYAGGSLLTAEASCAMLLDRLLGPDGEQTGAIWDLAETVETLRVAAGQRRAAASDGWLSA